MACLMIRATVRTTIRALAVLLAGCAAAAAQDRGTLDPKPLPPLANPDDPNTAGQGPVRPQADARGRSQARAIGYYTGRLPRRRRRAADQRQDLAGDAAVAQPQLGPPQPDQVPRALRRQGAEDRLGHGLLVGDMAQPRGGPMLTGHWSHQVGLDADIWLTPMPDRELTRQEREEMSATNIVADDWKDVNPKIWSPAHIALLQDRRAGQRRSSACWSTRRSRRRCAATSRATAPGCTRSARCSATTITSTSASAVPRDRRAARRNPPRRPTKAAARTSTGGSPERRVSEARAGARPPFKMSALPAACSQVLLAE